MQVIIINLYTGVQVILHLLVKKLALGHIPEEKYQNLYRVTCPRGPCLQAPGHEKSLKGEDRWELARSVSG